MLPSLEAGIDRDSLYEVDYHCMTRAIAACGYVVRTIDPLDREAMVAALADPDYPVVLTARSQSKDWALPPPGTAAFETACDKTLITLVGNPPFYGGSLGFHDSVFRHKLAMCADHDSIGYARSINRSEATMLPYRPAFHDFGLEDEPAWRPTSQRSIPILFVGTYDDPDVYRSAWQRQFARFPRVVAAIEAAAEILGGDVGRSVIGALDQAMAEVGHMFDLRSRAGRLALEALARFAGNRARQRLLAKLVRYPSTIVTTGRTGLPDPHPGCTFSPPMPFDRFLDAMKQARCLVTLNPNCMTGALSERVSNAMRRGTLVVSAPNSALERYDRTATVSLGPALDGLEEWMEAALAGDPHLDRLGAAASEIARTTLRMDDAFAAVLDAAMAMRLQR